MMKPLIILAALFFLAACETVDADQYEPPLPSWTTCECEHLTIGCVNADYMQICMCGEWTDFLDCTRVGMRCVLNADGLPICQGAVGDTLNQLFTGNKTVHCSAWTDPTWFAALRYLCLTRIDEYCAQELCNE
jgi:hypothetical protein